VTKTFAMTGGATGIGASVKDALRLRGDVVIVADIKDADIVADLSTAEGRKSAIDGIARLAPDGLDGFIGCAGIGPNVKPPSIVDRVNFFGAVAVLEGIAEQVAQRSGTMVAVSSNSATLPGLNEEHIDALLTGDEEKACALVYTLDGHNAYAGSKNALAKWVRRNAPDYMRRGIRLNAVAPGMTLTPLTASVFEDETLGQAMRDFTQTIPYGSMATPDMIAEAILFLLDPAARFISGSILFVDGGQDALLRPDQF
jgi:NAD(P)-dependent dehydrogenase (short-subunit alcohol dehydrogenase family)